ncbi:HNH nuclease [Methylophilaceae bacterium]
MNYWWVNQNQTYKHEVGGGYIWSPQANANGHLNPFYENMRKVAVGDVVFSFKDTLIPAIGVITSTAYSQPKPSEFGSTGENWDQEGWCVDVDYHELSNQIRPKDHMNVIESTLPGRYSPLQNNGNGNQGVYLTAVPLSMAEVILKLIGNEAYAITNNLRDQDILEVESIDIEKEIRQNTSLEHTEKVQLVKSRRGQGTFRTNLERIEKACRVTGVTAKEHLRASHIKPWRDSSNPERLDGYNGLLLSPHIDTLFDKGYISFTDDGEMLVSSETDTLVLSQWGLRAKLNVGTFNEKQKVYLAYHRVKVYKL